MVTLFGTLESGNVHKVQMILARVGVPYRRVEVSQSQGHTLQPAFRELNPLGKVPVVIVEDGRVLTESGALLYWFARKTELWPESPKQRAEVLRWMYFEQYSHQPALSQLRQRRCLKHSPELSAESPPVHDAELERQARRALDVMERQLELRTFIAAPACTIADYALYPFTKWADPDEVLLAPYPEVRRWLSAIEAQPRFVPLLTDAARSVVGFDDYFAATANFAAAGA